MNAVPVVLNASDAVVAVVVATVCLVAAVEALLDAVAHEGERYALAEARSKQGRARKLLLRIAL